MDESSLDDHVEVSVIIDNARCDELFGMVACVSGHWALISLLKGAANAVNRTTGGGKKATS
jgi:hypothetical protein